MESASGASYPSGFSNKEEELELFLLDRERDHVQKCINPALAAGHIILTDRYYFSTAAYQGAAGGDLAAIFNRNAFAPEPDLVLLLTISADEGFAASGKIGESLQ